jgi:hypothetical protein
MNGAQRMADSFRRRIRTDLIGCNQCSQCGDKSFSRFDKPLCVVRADRVAAVVGDDAGFLRPFEQTSNIVWHGAVFHQVLTEGGEHAAMGFADINSTLSHSPAE